jgi:hypothetical protein
MTIPPPPRPAPQATELEHDLRIRWAGVTLEAEAAGLHHLRAALTYSA